MIFIYLAAIVIANLTVTYFGPAASIVNALFFIGLDLTARDSLHERWKGKNLVRNMFLLIFAGSLFSWLLNRDAGRIATASLIAFAAASTMDTVVYHLLKDKPKFTKINGSNIFSAAADSLLFPLIAFGWPPLVGIMMGQFAAKVLGGAFWAAVIHKAQKIEGAEVANEPSTTTS